MTAEKKEQNKPIDAPIVDEIRNIRERIAQQFGNDVQALCEHLRELESRHRGPVVTLGQAAAK